MSTGLPLVVVEKVTKVYPMGSTRVEALRGADVHVDDGEFLAIMGPSGSGKSTLLNILGCLDRPSSGTYLLAGQDVSRLSDRKLSHIRATKIGFVFQTYNLIHQLNVLENVEVPFIYNGIEDDIAHGRAVEALGRVGLAHRMSHRPSELSGGEMQRVAIARALAIEPQLILADEPTGNLDSGTGREILKLFHELNTHGATIIMVTHNHDVAKHAGRVIQLFDGVVVRDGEPG
ncbi:MAG: ABC transporter ATP-binding protein [Candidatus Binatia bacterium]